MKTIEEILSKLEYSISENAPHNIRFTCPKGKRYRIYWESKNGRRYSKGPFINIQYKNVTYPIGSRVFYASYEDAQNVADLWKMLIDNSTTRWKPCFDKIYVVDTEVTLI